MALRTAKIFKDFNLNASENYIELTPRESIDVFVKNDNFSNNFEILNNSDVDFYKFKYFTMDNFNIFEIADIIINGKYVTIFVNYLTGIKLNTENNDFYIESVSAETLAKLGLDVNELLEIIGKNGKSNIENVFEHKNENQINFFYAVKIRLSECPQNLSTMIVPEFSESAQTVTRKSGGIVGKDLNDNNYSAVINSKSNLNVNSRLLKQFDTAFTVVIPVPFCENTELRLKEIETERVGTIASQITIAGFIQRLNALITDLTLSVELTVFSENSLVLFSKTTQAYNAIDFTFEENPTLGTRYAVYTIPFSSDDDGSLNAPNAEVYAGMLRDIDLDGDNVRTYPVFCLNTYGYLAASKQVSGFAEIYRPFDIFFRGDNDTDKYYTSIMLLNSEISLKDCRNDYITLFRKDNILRVFLDFEKNIYIDISTSLEYAKDAYSNYEAYKKANIDLLQAQQNASLTQTQKQARDLQTVQTSFHLANSLNNALQSGNPLKLLGAGITAAVQTAQSEITFNMQQENEKANLRLAQAQEHEKARITITPANETTGSLAYNNAFISGLIEDNTNSPAFFSLRYFNLNNRQTQLNLERYAFENYILDRVTDTSNIKRPEWQTMHNSYMVKLQKSNVKLPQKSCYIFVYGKDWAESASKGTFIAGERGLPTIETNTGFVGNLSNNPGAGVTFSFYAFDDCQAHINLYTTRRRQGGAYFQDIWVAQHSYPGGVKLITTNPYIPAGDAATEWTQSYAIDLGAIDLKRGENTITINVKAPTITDRNGNIDKLTFDTETGIRFL